MEGFLERLKTSGGLVNALSGCFIEGFVVERVYRQVLGYVGLVRFQLFGFGAQYPLTKG